MKDNHMIALSLALILIVGCFSGCAAVERRQCIRTLEEFQKNCQNENVDGIMDCLSQRIVGKIRGLTGKVEFVLGFDDDELLSDLSNLLFGISFISDPLKSIRFNVQDTDMEKEVAVLSGEMVYENLFGNTVSRGVTISMVKEDGVWKIDRIGSKDEE